MVAILILAFAAAAGLAAQTSTSTDWPQWRGPNRDGISQETGLLKQWPPAGPPRVWSISNLGAGYGSVAISGDRIYVQSRVGRQSTVASLNRADGKMLWSRPLGPAGENDRGPGPRSTPTVDVDRVYVLTEMGDLAALKTVDGVVLWQRNILKDFGGSNISWDISESPLVDGNMLIVTPGGRGGSVVALDKMSGKPIWTSKELSDEAGYASIIAANVQGVRTLMTITGRAGVGLRASDGKLMWRYPRVANGTANIATPIFHDNKVFYTTDYGTGGALLGLKAEGGSVTAQEVYFTRDMKNHHGGVVLVNGYLYGFNSSILTCIEFVTGKMLWRDRSVGKGSLTYADGNLYVLSEGNIVGLVGATPGGYQEKGRFQIPDQGWPSWAHPVVSGGRLYIRNQGTLMAYNVRP